jgi:hypothetical protein
MFRFLGSGSVASKRKQRLALEAISFTPCLEDATAIHLALLQADLMIVIYACQVSETPSIDEFLQVVNSLLESLVSRDLSAAFIES